MANGRLGKAMDYARDLEAAIAEARELYGPLGHDAVAAFVEPLAQELYATRGRIYSELGIEQPSTARASVWVSLKGGRVGEGTAPLSAIGKVLGGVQTGVRQLANYLETGDAALRRVASWIADEAALDMVGFQPGSARIAVAPQNPQLRVDLETTLADAALGRLLVACRWAESEGTADELEKLFPSPRLRRQVASRVRDIAPGESDDYESVDLSGPLVDAVVGQTSMRVDFQAYVSATRYLQSRLQETVRYRGKLVAIDVEKDTFELRYEGGRLRCDFGEEIHDRAKDLLEAFVEVRGIGVFREDAELPSRMHVEEIRGLLAAELDDIALGEEGEE